MTTSAGPKGVWKGPRTYDDIEGLVSGKIDHRGIKKERGLKTAASVRARGRPKKEH